MDCLLGHNKEALEERRPPLQRDGWCREVAMIMGRSFTVEYSTYQQCPITFTIDGVTMHHNNMKQDKEIQISMSIRK